MRSDLPRALRRRLAERSGSTSRSDAARQRRRLDIAVLEALESRQLLANISGGTTAASLIAAINSANDETANPGPDVITLSNTTYTLTAADNAWYGPNGLPAITSDITIDGNGATIERSTAANTPNFRLIYVAGSGGTGADSGFNAGTLTLENLTLQGGLAQGGAGSDGGGGGAGLGGAIYNQGTVNLTGVLVASNTAKGGAGGAADSNPGGGGGLGGDGGTGLGGGGGGGGFNAAGGAASNGGGGGGGINGAGGEGELGGGGGGGLADAGANADTDGGKGGGPDGGSGGPTGTPNGGNGGNGLANSGGGGGGQGLLINPQYQTGGNGGSGGKGGFAGGGGGGGSGGSFDTTSSSSSGGNGGFGGGGGGGGLSFNDPASADAGRGGDGGVGGGGGAAGDNVGNGRGGDGGFGAGGGKGTHGRGGNGGFGGGGGATASDNTAGTSEFGGGDGAVSGGAGGGGAGMGGGIFNDGGSLKILNSTFTTNAATGGTGGNDGEGLGGAIFTRNGTVTINDSTLSANTVSTTGRDLYMLGDDDQATGFINNSILGQTDSSIPDFMARIINANGSFSLSQDNNLVTNNSGASGTDPQLAPLADNGGPTKTFGLLETSPAINAGDKTAVPAGVTTDQRGPGFPRVSGASVDIGAFEASVTESLVVTTTADEDNHTSDPSFGTGTSLREAINYANAHPGADTITFNLPAHSTINLTKQLPVLNEDVDIKGPGADQLTLKGANDQFDDIFNLYSAVNATISGMTLTNTSGRAINNQQGLLTVADSVFLNNTSLITGQDPSNGGAILSVGGKLTLTGDTFTGNTATASAAATSGAAGGAVYSESEDLTVDQCTFSSNEAQAGATAGGATGGAIDVVPGDGDAVVITNSTFDQNSADDGGFGGAIEDGATGPGSHSSIKIINSTFYKNSAKGGASSGGDGGAIFTFDVFENSTLDLTVINSTFNANTAAGSGGGIFTDQHLDTGDFDLSNSILYGNTAGQSPDLAAAPDQGDNNLVGDLGTDSTLHGTHNITQEDPKLAPLANNGGPTQTMALMSRSPAINAGDNSLAKDAAGNALTTDQRGAGFPRIVGGTVDIGAFESASVPLTVTINKAAGQADPTSASPILFDVKFSEPVTGFESADVDFTGSTAPGALSASVSGSGDTYTVSVSGMTGPGNIVASISFGAAQSDDAFMTDSAASTSTDNSVTYNVPIAAPQTITLQAEDAAFDTNSKAMHDHSGYKGTGFVNMIDKGATVEFTVNAATYGPTSKLEFRYANNGSTSRPMDVYVDGVKIGTLSFDRTGSWSSWSTASISTSLSPGWHMIEVVATSSHGGPNLDQLAVIPVMPSKPAKPTGLDATALSKNSIKVTWNEASSNVTGFHLERSTSSSFSSATTMLFTLPANTRSYTDMGLAPNTKYYYKIEAFNGAGSNGYTGSNQESTKK